MIHHNQNSKSVGRLRQIQRWHERRENRPNNESRRVSSGVNRGSHRPATQNLSPPPGPPGSPRPPEGFQFISNFVALASCINNFVLGLQSEFARIRTAGLGTVALEKGGGMAVLEGMMGPGTLGTQPLPATSTRQVSNSARN